jgi:hypothetical protein
MLNLKIPDPRQKSRQILYSHSESSVPTESILPHSPRNVPENPGPDEKRREEG